MQRRRWRLSSHAYELFLIGDQQAEGSSKQRPVYTLSMWLFDKGDGAILPPL